LHVQILTKIFRIWIRFEPQVNFCFKKISVEANITLGWSVQKTKSKKLRPGTNINNHLPSPNIDGDQMQNRPIRGADRQRRISDRNGHDHTQEKIQSGSINQVYGRRGQKFSRRHNTESDSSSVKSNEPEQTPPEIGSESFGPSLGNAPFPRQINPPVQSNASSWADIASK